MNYKTRLYSIYPILVIILCASFQFYKYVLQVYPSIITQQLTEEFHLTGAGLGNLTATFYYAFIITQLFVGILLDKFGVRMIASTAIFCATAGVLLFSISHSALSACMFRAMIGTGAAFSTVTYMKSASMLFRREYYTFVVGLLATWTMAGAIFGELPLLTFIHLLGWRNCLFAVGIGGLALAFAFILVVKDNFIQHSVKIISSKDIFRTIVNKNNLLLMLYGGLAFSPLSIFGGLWGNPFLQKAYHLDKTQSASMISLIFLGLGIGSPLIGFLASRVNDKIQLMFYFTFIAFLSISIVIYFHHIPIYMLGMILFVFGFSLGAYLLAFVVATDMNNVTLTATVIAMINSGDAILTGISEPVIGKLLDLVGNNHVIQNAGHFSLASYQIALMTLPIYLAIAILICLFIKNKTAFNLNMLLKRV